MIARYWIAQYLREPIRMEPKNVGVIVRLGDAVAAKFVGETRPGEFDARKLRGFPHPDVYRQWVEYWRRELDRNGPEGLSYSAPNYRTVEGGEVSGIDATDSIDDVLNYIYALLVSEGGFTEAIDQAAEDAADNTAQFAREIEVEFMRLDILRDEPSLFVRSPVRRNMSLPGRTGVTYKPSFVQVNGRHYVMEPVDFTTRQKRRALDHAGFSAYMFHDLRTARGDVEPISLVRYTPADTERSEVAEALRILGAEARVVNWHDERERAAFLEERRRIAMSDAAR